MWKWGHLSQVYILNSGGSHCMFWYTELHDRVLVSTTAGCTNMIENAPEFGCEPPAQVASDLHVAEGSAYFDPCTKLRVNTSRFLFYTMVKEWHHIIQANDGLFSSSYLSWINFCLKINVFVHAIYLSLKDIISKPNNHITSGLIIKLARFQNWYAWLWNCLHYCQDSLLFC